MTAHTSGARKPAGAPWIGQSLPRFEDLRLTRGAGRYTDDFVAPGQMFAAFVRSPHAHAHIVLVDATEARAIAGVVAVLTADDYAADGCGAIPQLPVPADAVDHALPAFVASQGRPVLNEFQPVFAAGRGRYPGEIVAMVVAQSRALAQAAADAVAVEYDVLDAVTDPLAALGSDAPQVSPQAAGNLAMLAEFGDVNAAADVFARAPFVVMTNMRNQRVATAQMEPRSAFAQYDAAQGVLELVTGCQSAHRIRLGVTACLGMPNERVRVICPDTGGGFGTRSNPYPEQIAVAWAARKLGVPVKWTSDRSEAFLTDFQGRDSYIEGRMALDHDGGILATAFDTTGNCGAYGVSYVPLNNGWRISASAYRVPLTHMRVRAALTHSVPTAPYRGAGRPETIMVIERLLDLAAGATGLSRVEIRRRNLVPVDALPWRTVTGLRYDSGDFAGNLDAVLGLADWRGFEARRAVAQSALKCAGIAVALYVECPVGAPHERVEIRVDPQGFVELAVGTQSTGQGHETSFAQVIADLLGVEPADVRVISGDTKRIATGGGTHSDRSMRMAGTLMAQAGGEVIARGRRIAAAILGVNESTVEFSAGLFETPASNRKLTIFDLAKAVDGDEKLPADLRTPLAATATFTGRIPAHPTGAAVCEVEVDPQTGVVEITRYASVDDAGQPVNPMILHGQVHGGIVQGLGQALMESVVWDAQSGQMLTGSFMDYAMPRASDVPSFDVALVEHPTPGNPLRIKGGGEGGTTPSLAVVMNAVHDALRPLGVEQIDMPATPFRVWSAIRKAQSGGA